MFLIQLHSEKQDWMLHLNVLRVFMIRLSELGQAIASWVPGWTTAGTPGPSETSDGTRHQIDVLLGGELPTNRLGGLVHPGFLNGIFVGAIFRPRKCHERVNVLPTFPR